MEVTPQQRTFLLSLLEAAYPAWQGVTDTRFVKDEVEYKRKAVAQAQSLLHASALRALLAEGNVDAIIKRLRTVAAATNLLYMSTPETGDLALLNAPALDKLAFCEEFVDLLHGSGDGPERLGRFSAWAAEQELPNKWTFPTYYLFLVHPESNFFVKPSYADWMAGALDPTFKRPLAPAADAYGRFLEMGHALIAAFADAGAADMVDAQSILWVCALAAKHGTQKYWKLAPGEEGKFWGQWRDEGHVGIGWTKLGDLTGVSKAEFDARVAAHAAPPDQYTKQGTSMVWKFVREIQEGDRVVVNRGISKVVAVGTIAGPYYFDGQAGNGHKYPVIWDDLTERKVDQPGWVKTLIQLDAATFNLVSKPIIDGKTNYPFTPRTFELLEGIEKNPTVTFYDAQAPEIQSHIEEPFKRVMLRVADALDSRIRLTMETEQRIFARFHKNDFGKGGLWPFYWGAFYPKGGKRSADAQLSLWINHEFLEYGFYIGDYGSEQRKRFVHNVQTHAEAIRVLMEEQIANGTVFFGDRGDYVLDADGPTYKSGSPRTWADFVADPRKFYCDVSFVAPRARLLEIDEDALVDQIRLGHEALYPLVLLAILDDPMPAIIAYVSPEAGDDGGDELAAYTETDFIAATFLPMEAVAELRDLLDDRKQLLFYVPPGTGKTFVARELGRLLTGLADPPPERLEIVQFHPAYGYEDFIEGIRPESKQGANGTHVVDYPTRAGVFLRFCQQARTIAGPCVFIIDEMNRGNIARIFGELMILLEYRDESVPLPYSGSRFSIPRNVFIIGTMNTADRSIALVDFALRRRFQFFHFGADPELLQRWLAANPVGIPYLPELYRRLAQDAIDDPAFAIGPSHFMRPNLTETRLRLLWKRSIEPYLEEYYYDKRTHVDRWRWEGEIVAGIRGKAAHVAE